MRGECRDELEGCEYQMRLGSAKGGPYNIQSPKSMKNSFMFDKIERISYQCSAHEKAFKKIINAVIKSWKQVRYHIMF